MTLGSFTGMGFHSTIDINSKLNWCFFISRLALKENIKVFERKRFGFKLTNNKITEITYKEKCFLEFYITMKLAPSSATTPFDSFPIGVSADSCPVGTL